MESALHKFKPAIPRRALLVIAGLVWTAVGFVLCGRAVGWAFAAPPVEGFSLLIAGVPIAAAGYRFGFSKIVRRNTQRIHALPERPCLFAFTPLHGYFMIALMVTMGITLRNSSLNKVYLILPYVAMGGVLLIGSFGFYKEFLDSRRHSGV